MKRKRKKSQPSHRILSVAVRLTETPITMDMDPPYPAERELCKNRLGRLGHYRTIANILDSAGLTGSFCWHNCCENPDCPIITIDFKANTDWGEARIIGKSFEDWVISVFDRSGGQAAKCPSLRPRQILTQAETELLVGLVIQVTMPYFVHPEVLERDMSLGKTHTGSYLTTGDGENRWIEIAAATAFSVVREIIARCKNED